jgi:hypothetical protein
MNESVNDTNYKNWIRRMLETQEEEISCTRCLDLVSQYVDLELAGREPETILPQLKHHLDQCQVCREEHQILHDLARLEAEWKLPPIQDLQDPAK